MKDENFYRIFGSVRKSKIDELKLKINRLKISLGDIEEKFTKGGGKGGQKINKTNNAVILRYKPLNIIVKCQKDRSLGVNRFLALRDLIDKIEKEANKRRNKMLLEGKTPAREILDEVKRKSEIFFKLKGRKPSLSIINYFENSPSTYYMNLKIKKCKEVGIETNLYTPNDKTDKNYFLSLIDKLNNDDNVDAIMIEKPLPEGFDDYILWEKINPKKDVDALSSINMGNLFITRSFYDIEENKFFVPQTAYATIKLIKYYNIELSGKKVVVLGRSSIVGKPLAIMLSLLDASVSICHSKTRNLREYLKNADIIAVAIGRPRYIKSEMIGKDQIIIDIGTNLDESQRLCGDVDFDDVKENVKAITPVPGGVGPLTLACLLKATINAAIKNNNLKIDP